MDANTFSNRRKALRGAVSGGVILIPGNKLSPRNYRDNVFPFRQSSHVLYYAGVSLPDVALVVDEDGSDILFGPPEDIDDIIWHGPHATLADLAAQAGIAAVRDRSELAGFIAEARADRRPIHYLKPYQSDVLLWLAEVLGDAVESVRRGASVALAHAVANQRLSKSAAEVAEVEEALGVTADMHHAAMRITRPGILEAEVAAAIQDIALGRDRAQAYNPIVTVRGEVLHNNTYANRLQDGQMLLNDSGAESTRFYASDITRTYPVSGRFDARQRTIYGIALETQLGAIAGIRPGVSYRDVHLGACRLMAEGLKDAGLMRGSTDDAVAAGAHALFFPHGLGHMLGLDVHDMEDLGDVVGYPEGEARSDQFGLNFLRLARPLAAGHVFTIEPGIYFIPALIDRWAGEGRHAEFIDYDAVARYRDLGGVRIEDDVLCTESGARVLGPGIAKTIEEVEAVMAS